MRDVPAFITDKLRVFNDARFRFEEKEHEYFLEKRRLLHFTEWFEPYHNPFDEVRVANRMALERGCSPQVFLDEWKFAREVIGTRTHHCVEQFYRRGDGLIGLTEHAEVQRRFQKFRAIHGQRLQGFVPVALEQPVWCEITGHCGTFDALLWHVERRELWVFDWKTNKRFITVYNELKGMLLGLFAHLPDNELTKYSIQLSYYRILLARAGIDTAGGVLIHLGPGSWPAEMHKAIDYRALLEPLLT